MGQGRLCLEWRNGKRDTNDLFCLAPMRARYVKMNFLFNLF
nr:MAG TPA_asm: hypothetical protein [Bacteriophage sp.]